VLTAVALALPWYRRGAASVAGILSLGFFLVVGAALLRGEKFPCGCFGDTDDEIGAPTLWRSGLMTGAAAWVALTTPAGAESLETWSQAILLASIVVGTPPLIGAVRRLAAMRAELDEALNWEWILQQSHHGLEHAPATVQPPRGDA
jgi:hypothetical protein